MKSPNVSSCDHSASALFQPLRIGRNILKHRVVLAPLTRCRADDSHVAQLPILAEYYSQRAVLPGTFLITEANIISPRAGSYVNSPGLWNMEQLTSWKQVTDAVHARGSFIYAQLCALGRATSAEELQKETGLEYVSSSATPLPGSDMIPKELLEEDIMALINDYRQAAKNAVDIAGFDGVEIHGANGYVIDQFTQDTANQRTDRWGGSIENRSRFALEVAKAVVEEVGADRVGLRLSPWSDFQGMRMANPVPQFSHLIKALKELNLASLHLVESRISDNSDIESSEKLDFATEVRGNISPVLFASGFKPASAFKTVDEDYQNKDVDIVFGRSYIANPDLPYRLLKSIELRPYDRRTFYDPKVERGYIDYEASRECHEEHVMKISASGIVSASAHAAASA